MASDSQTIYRTSRAITIQFAREGHLVARSAIDVFPQRLSLEGLTVLSAFAAGATRSQVFTKLEADWELDPAEFDVVVDRLIALNFLAPVGQNTAGTPTHSELATGHHLMLRDAARVFAYRDAIYRHAPGKTVLEIGCGSGLLSIFAAKAGAARVIAIEESRVADLAQEMFEANGVADRIELRRGNSRDVELGERVDLVVHELIGTQPLAEHIVDVMSDARTRFLKEGGRLLPQRLEVCCMGIESEQARRVAEAAEFGGQYGLRFEPLVRWLEREHAPYGSVPQVPPGEGRFDALLLSDECRLLDIDLTRDTAASLRPPRDLKMRMARSGWLGAVVLYFRAHMDEHLQLSNSPLLPSTNWSWPKLRLSRTVPVAAGEEVALDASVESGDGLEKISVDLWTPAEVT